MKSAVTLIELLIVVAIIIIIASIAIPTFIGVSDKQSLEQAVQNFASNIRLVQSKALSGAVDSTGSNVWWGIRTCASGSNTKYGLGYNVDPADPANSFIEQSVKELPLGNYITSDCNVGLYFKRLSGILHDSSGSEMTSYTVGVTNSSVTRNVVIHKSGKIDVQ